MTVWMGEELKVFATAEAAQAWFEENDPEGVAFVRVRRDRPANVIRRISDNQTLVARRGSCPVIARRA